MITNIILSLPLAESIIIPQPTLTQGDSPAKHHSVTGPIVGGVVGTVALGFFATLIALCRRNWKRGMEVSRIDVFIDPSHNTAHNHGTFDPQTSNTTLRMTSRQEPLHIPRVSEKTRQPAVPNSSRVHDTTLTTRDADQNIPVVDIQNSDSPGRSGRSQGSPQPSAREVRGLRAELESLRRAVEEMNRERLPPSYSG